MSHASLIASKVHTVCSCSNDQKSVHGVSWSALTSKAEASQQQQPKGRSTGLSETELRCQAHDILYHVPATTRFASIVWQLSCLCKIMTPLSYGSQVTCHRCEVRDFIL